MRTVGATIAIAALSAAFAPAPHADTTGVVRLISTFDDANVVVDREPLGAVSKGDVIVSFDRLANAAA